jgi:toxin YoeB
MKFCWDERAWDDYLHWQAHDKAIVKRINNLLREFARTPFEGTGSPEPLRHKWSGHWSRRIDHEHRLVYRVEGEFVYVAQCRYHY